MNNIFLEKYNIDRVNRNKLNKHKSFVIWFTGLSGSGKSTIANIVERELYKLKVSTFILDGDNIRHGLNKDLNFSIESRKENIRRIGEVSKLFIDAGLVTLATFVSPIIKDRESVKNLVGAKNFFEIYIKTSLNKCEERDTKGLYKKARLGEIKNMTGITSPYEAPIKPDLEIDTEVMDKYASAKKVLNFIKSKL